MSSDGSPPLRVAVLASGRGSNLDAIARAIEAGRVPARIVVLLSDRAEAGALAIARAHGIEALVIPPAEHPSREAHEKAVTGALDARRVELVCLAGYLRVLGPGFVRHWAGRILNIHPALLPAFPGRDAQRQALEHGVKVAGATVHFVDEGVDTGPIVLQAAIAVREDDTPDTLARRILVEEHRIYPEAIRLFAERRLRIAGRRVHLTDAAREGA
ncbi:MAG: phosphoribosylglycinamide formyltransferase [Candidatus Rokubacteria bacterium]|nr:phosphoribosylglycinamide formyltransferase [Candidatus Rokubacteria bacterium]